MHHNDNINKEIDSKYLKGLRVIVAVMSIVLAVGSMTLLGLVFFKLTKNTTEAKLVECLTKVNKIVLPEGTEQVLISYGKILVVKKEGKEKVIIDFDPCKVK
ncbi:MAG: hypothetical protein J0H68_04945 [Sphingobacteriia bacterium]|nr:hypothetical protein [Sphingobacteriia bacterium]